jgi:hypothetical protein
MSLPSLVYPTLSLLLLCWSGLFGVILCRRLLVT